MFVANEDQAAHTQCIGRAVSSSPTGPFVDSNSQPVLCHPTIGGDIDPDIFTAADGQSYLIWKTDGNSIDMPTYLWSQPLDANFNLIGSPSLLLGADQSWQGGIVEAPNMIQVGSQYYLFYGGGSYAGASYAVGVALCAGPEGPCQDGAYNPILNSGVGMFGPGGPSLFQSPSGQLLMAFSGWPLVIGYPQGRRAMYLATVSFFGTIPVLQPTTTPEPAVPQPTNQGYWEVAADGGIFTFGDAGFYGSEGGQHLNQPIVGMAATPDGKGYWLVAADGGIFTFGDAGFYGSEGGQHLNQPIVGMAATPDGKGYWLVAADGGIFTFGDAGFYGSMGNQHLNAPVVGIAADPATGGYWEVAADGGVFTFNAPYDGSAGGQHLNKSFVGIAADPNGEGYWLADSDGGVSSFGTIGYFGSMKGQPLNAPMVGIAAMSDGGGYRMDAADGGIFTFGDAGYYGSMGGQPLNAPVVGMATS